MLRTVGDTAERVSRRRLEPLPRIRGCSVLMESLGRSGACRGGGIIGSWVVILDMADDCEYDGVIEREGCDGCKVDSIMCLGSRGRNRRVPGRLGTRQMIWARGADYYMVDEGHVPINQTRLLHATNRPCGSAAARIPTRGGALEHEAPGRGAAPKIHTSPIQR